jgi:hypothetical protein
MSVGEVNAHYNKTGHGTYNEKLLTSAQYKARFG